MDRDDRSAKSRHLQHRSPAQVNVSYTPDVFGANSPRGRIARGAGRKPALPARSDLPDLDLQHRGRGGAGGLPARPDRRDAEDHPDRKRLCSNCCADRTSLGQIAEADVVAQEAALAQIQQTLPPLQRQLEQQRHLIAALVGRFPSQGPTRPFDLVDAASAARSAGQPAVATHRAAPGRARRGSESAFHQRPASALRSPIGCPISRSPLMPAARRSRCRQAVLASHRLLDARRQHPAADLPRRRADTARGRRARRLRSGGGAISQHGDHRVPERRRCVDRALQTDADALQKAVAAERAASRSLDDHAPAPASSATSTISCCSMRSRPISRR